MPNRARRIPAIVVTVLALSGCGPSDNEKFQKLAEKELTSLLIDPESVKFEAIKIKDEGGVKTLIGCFNAKNRFGGYAGKKPFTCTGGISPIPFAACFIGLGDPDCRQ
jgi:hypothetical protein